MNGFETILPFLKPLEHLILDDSISEVMVNGGDRVFFEKDGYLQQAEGVSIGDKALMVAVKNIARRLQIPGNLYGEARRLLRDKIKAHDIHIGGSGLDLGSRDDQDAV